MFSLRNTTFNLSRFMSTHHLKPPTCSYKPHIHEHHGDKREDGYFWLKDKKNKEVTSYLNSENEYFDQVYKSLKMDELSTSCYNEFISRLQQTDQEVPIKYKDYQYYHRTMEGKEYKIYSRQKINTSNDNIQYGEEEILIDLNEIAKDEEYCELGIYSISPSNRYLAYGIDFEGDELFTLHILDMTTSPPTVLYDSLLEEISCNLFFFFFNQNQNYFSTKFF